MRRFVLVLVFVVVATACGGEQISEQILEESIGGDANVDIEGSGDDVTINIESDEGSISIGGGEVPGEITVPIPDGGDVTSSLVSEFVGGVNLAYPNERYEELVAFYDSMVANSSEAGWNVVEQTVGQPGGVTMRQKSYQATETATFIVVRDCYGPDSSFEGPFDSACLDISEEFTG